MRVGPAEIASRISVWVGQAKRTVSPHLPFLPFIVLSTWIFVGLARVFLLRLGYPLDLEWMEGGMLVHALRLGSGQPLYAEPSVDFVSFPYTPLYPAVLGVLSKIFGLSYILGRAVSILAFCGSLVLLVAAVRGIAQQFESKELQAVATTAGLLGAAAVCLAFPFCGAFYDLVRCDSLWLFLVSAGVYSCSPGRSMSATVLGALLLVLAFFTKQTAAPFMVATAASMAFTSGIKRGLVFSAVAFGSTATGILVGQYLTDGWQWFYIYRLHQSHETRFEKIWPETPRVLFDYGFMLLVPIAACLLLVAFRRRLSPRLFYWAFMAATALATAAVASATQGAYDNAYIPAIYFGALLSAACAGRARGPRRRPERFNWRRCLVLWGAPKTVARIAADLQSSRPGAAIGPRHDQMAGPVPPCPQPAGSRGSEEASGLSHRAGAGDLCARPPLLQRPGRRKGASPYHGGERCLLLATRDHLGPRQRQSHQGTLSRQRDELVQIQAMEDGHPGRLPHASAFWAQRVLPPRRRSCSKREGPSVPNGVSLYATLCLGAALTRSGQPCRPHAGA